MKENENGTTTGRDKKCDKLINSFLLRGNKFVEYACFQYGAYNAAISGMERGLPISINEKQKATMRATPCFLYLKAGYENKANRLASELPHTRESREVIQPLIQQGDGKGIW